MDLNQAKERSYENAIRIIDSRRRQTRPKSVARTAETTKGMPGEHDSTKFKGTPSIAGMAEWLQMLGHSAKEIDALNVIHIAGTKGKGSTCSFTESFLRAHGQRTGYPRRTGMYTSPHLILPEERIRINSEPLSPVLFAKYFFEMYDKLPLLAVEFDEPKPLLERGPRSLQLYALLAFHVFVRENVDTAIIETHNGGEYDATNVVHKPLVTAITTLGMDHVEMLGPTIEDIAWHKSGIFKTGAAALSTVQNASATRVLEERAGDKSEEVHFVDNDARLPLDAVQLQPAVQRKNASLALAVAETFLCRTALVESEKMTEADIRLGVKQWVWPGRFQIIPDTRCTWFLDSAHNEMSVEIAAEWFSETCEKLDPVSTRVVIFSHISESRDTLELLRSLAKTLKGCNVAISHVVFTTYDESDDKKAFVTPAEDSALFHETWRTFFPHAKICSEPTIQGAVQMVGLLATEDASNVQALVTGSQHLVGPALRLLQPK